jgi:hypothetical protein
VNRHLTFFKSIEVITDTEVALALTFGSDIYISSWLNFGADLSWGIPGTDLDKDSLAGRPEFIRRSYGPGDGGMIFLPRRRQLVNEKEAPFEILVRLADEDMTRVLNEESGLSCWADAIIEWRMFAIILLLACWWLLLEGAKLVLRYTNLLMTLTVFRFDIMVLSIAIGVCLSVYDLGWTFDILYN